MIYLLALQSSDSERAALHSLRAVLKYAKRRGLRALYVREHIASRRDARRRIVRHTSVETEAIMVNLRKYGPTNKFLKVDDLLNKPPMVGERIGLITEGVGNYGEQLTVTFMPSGKMLSLNQTSVGNLLKDFGEESDGWLGQAVEIFVDQVKTKDGMKDAILVRAAPEAPDDAAATERAVKTAKKAAAKATKANDIDDTIPF